MPRPESWPEPLMRQATDGARRGRVAVGMEHYQVTISGIAEGSNSRHGSLVAGRAAAIRAPFSGLASSPGLTSFASALKEAT